MKSPYQIAKELKVSPQAVYQKIDRMKEQLNKHIQQEGKKTLLDEEGEALLKSTFQNVVEQELQQEIEQTVEQDVEQGLLNRLNKQLITENEYLREQNKLLQKQLQEQSSKILEQNERVLNLTENLVELNRNNQLLLGAEQSRTNPALLMNSNEQNNSEGIAENTAKKTSIFSKLFRKK